MASDVLRARVDPEFAERVRAWAEAHDTDVSETVRLALRRLLEEEERRQRVEEAMRRFREIGDAGVFDPPTNYVKPGGFK